MAPNDPDIPSTRPGNVRVAPHNLQAEESLLGAMLLARDAIAAASEVVRPADFYKPAHVHIFDAILSLYGSGEPVDPITVADELTRAGTLEIIGGSGALVALQANAPAISNAGRYGRIIEELAVLRRMIGAAGEIAELGYSMPEDVTKAVDAAESMIFDLAQHRNAGTTATLRQLLEQSLDRLEQLYERGESITGTPTGYLDLDELLSGLQPSALVVVGARPAMGKALALDTPLPTPTGWTSMGDVQPGDELLDEKGCPCTVTGATDVQHGQDCYAVTFDDGSTLVADADHQWFAYDLPAWKSKREWHDRHISGNPYKPGTNVNLARDQRARRKHPRVVTTGQMIEEGVRSGRDRRPNWYLPLTAPVDLPERDLRLDPYLLGCWLGDGHASGARITSQDEEIVQAFRDAGYHMEPTAAAGSAWTYSISYGHSTSKPWLQKMPDAAVVDGRARVTAGEVTSDVARELAGRYGYSRYDYVLRMLTGPGRPFAADDRPSFAAALIELGVIRRKHVPNDYMRSSAKQRMALLQGLLDTDGCVTNSNGTIELCLANRLLLEQARELVCSLGDKPGQIREKQVPKADGRISLAWRFHWTPLWDAFRLTRKMERLNAGRTGRANGRHTRRAVASIEPVASVPVRCIAVDSPSNLYLAGESMIPTHNTSFALGMASHAALAARRPVLFFSLEMSQLEITQRVLCSEARVDATRVRNGKLNENDWEKIGHAVGRLAEAPIWIDDNPNVTVMEIRSKARKLKSQIGDLGLVVVDYVQLMTGRSRAENRQVEVAEISRGLKILAREIETPVVALAQLNRGLEQRADKRPMLSDLRESGCLPASARIMRADNGAEITIGELVLSQEQPLVWSVDEHQRLVPARMTRAFPSGIKPVYAMSLASGRSVEASPNHPFLTVTGWKRLDELGVGSFVATPRRVAQPEEMSGLDDDELILLAHLLGDGTCGPSWKYATADPANKEVVEAAAMRRFGIEVKGTRRGSTWQLWFPAPYRLTHDRHHPMTNWMEPWGLVGARAWTKFIPESVFGLADQQVALFLRHLWAADGSLTLGRNRRGRIVRCYYATTSRRLAGDVQRLLLRFGIRSGIGMSRKAQVGRGAGTYRPGYSVRVQGAENIGAFLRRIGCHGARGECVEEALEITGDTKSNPNVDLVPWEISSQVADALARSGVTHRQLAAGLGERYCGSYLLGSVDRPRRFARDRLRRIGEITSSTRLVDVATSDLYWDEVVAIQPVGLQPTFDATVEGTHNFIADGIVVHNSLEQDADVVLFLYRDEIYNRESTDLGIAEVIVAKHRSGPTGLVRLAFLGQYTRFANMARS